MKRKYLGQIISCCHGKGNEIGSSRCGTRKGQRDIGGDVINEIHDGGCDVLDSSGRSMMDRRNPDCGH